MRRVLISIFICCLCSLKSYAEPLQVKKIGVLANHGFDQTLQRWTPLASYLSTRIPGYQFRILPLTHDDIRDMVDRSRVDFVITNPASFAELEANHGLSRLASMIRAVTGRAYAVYGSVIFTRANSGIRRLQDIRRKHIMAVHPRAFAGWWMAKRELLAQNIFTGQAFSRLEFTGLSQDQVVEAVLSGAADVGTVRTGLLEQLAQQNKIKLTDIRVLNPLRTAYFPLLHSTRLYPEWPFAASKQVPPALAKKVMLTLLSLDADSAAARAAGFSAWQVPLNYQPVHELMQVLKVGQYRQQLHFTDVLTDYGYWLLLLLLGMFGLCMLAIYMLGLQRRLVRTNTRLRIELTARKELEKKLRHLALYDALTQIPNRALFSDRLRQAMMHYERTGEQFAVALLGLDNFKTCHDCYGHQFSDELLKQVAKRIQQQIRGTDTLARFGGDEFVLLISDMKDIRTPLHLAKKSLMALHKPVAVHKLHFRIQASIGIAIFPQDGDNEINLLRRADMAMYAARHKAETAVMLFSDVLAAHA